jgi:DNA-binding NarL/FixJ family response regulator
VVLAAAYDRASITLAFDLGASGFIPKAAEREVMLNALRLIRSGGVYVPPEILGHDGAADKQYPPSIRRSAASPGELGLTARQIEVLTLMMQGKSNKAISRALDMAEPTVKNHITVIFKVLNVANRTEAVIVANHFGWRLPAIESP